MKKSILGIVIAQVVLYSFGFVDWGLSPYRAGYDFLFWVIAGLILTRFVEPIGSTQPQ